MDFQNAFPLVNELPSKHSPDTPGVVYEGDAFLARLSARDPEKQPVTYILTDGALPYGAFLDPSQGTITGTLSLQHFDTGETLKGDHTWFFTVGGFDGVKLKNQDFQITVKHINLPVQWDPTVGGAVLEMFEGQSIAQATVFHGSRLLGSVGNVVVRANAVPICAPVPFNSNLSQTAQDVVSSINANTGAGAPYTATYLVNSVFKVENAASMPVTVTAAPSGNMTISSVSGAGSIVLVDANGTATADVANALGYKVLGAVDPEASYDPTTSIIVYSANGALFDRNDPHAIPDCTMEMLANGIMTGALPEINGNAGQVVGKAGAPFPFDINVFDGQFNASRTFAILVKNVNQPPVWNDIPADGAELGPVPEGVPMTPITFNAFDVDGDTLTWGVGNVTVYNGTDIPTTIANIGLSFDTTTGTLSGTPSNDAVPADENISSITWYLANPNGATAVPADATYSNLVNGTMVFDTYHHPTESMFVTTATDASLDLTLGTRYRITYSIRMTQPSTNGIKAYVRPAFDGFLSGNPVPTVLGQRAGFGYVSSIYDVGYDFFDTSLWTVGQWYAITVDYTVAPDPVSHQHFVALRGRIRINRAAIPVGPPPFWNGTGYVNRADGPPYSNALFQMRGYSLAKHAGETYKFTTTVTDGQYTINRNHELTVGNKNEPPVWDTDGGLGSAYGNTVISIPIVAHDPEGNAIVYTQDSGSTPPGTTFSAGLLSGTVANVATPTTYNFGIMASDGSQTAHRVFTFTTIPAPNGPPIWSSPPDGSTIFVGEVGTAIPNIPLSAYDPEGTQVVFYSLDAPSGVLIANTTNTSAEVFGTMPSVAGPYTFTVQAASGGETTPRTFTIVSTIHLPAPDLTTHIVQEGGTYTYVVPSGTSPPVTSVNFDKLLGGGGGGGTGTQVGSGGGGGGGGAGGEITNMSVPVSAGDILDMVAGVGGAGGVWVSHGANVVNGGPGGDTTITHYNSDRSIVKGTYLATGGQGGAGCNNLGHGTITSPGGAGGVPDGAAGGTGPAGTSDSASSTGADGASTIGGVMGQGGVGGSLARGHVNGLDATGLGAGGGGGGSYDRSGPNSWNGGNGKGGYAQLTPQT